MKLAIKILISMIITILALFLLSISLLFDFQRHPKVDFPEELIPYITNNPNDTLDIKCYYDTSSKTTVFRFK